MAKRSRLTPAGAVTFAEDLRPEIGNKFSIMGIPQGPIALPQFPITLAKLAFVVQYFEHVGESDDPASIVVRLPGEEAPSHEFPIDVDQLRSERPEGDIEPDDPVVGIWVGITLAPLALKEPGFISVTVRRGGHEYRMGRHRFVLGDSGGGLLIQVGAPPDTPPT